MLVLMQSVWHKPDIAILEIWTIVLWKVGLLDCSAVENLDDWTVRPFDYNLI